MKINAAILKIISASLVFALLLGAIPLGTAAASAIVDQGVTAPAISGTQITVQAEQSGSYVEPVNTFTDGTVAYYLVTQDASKSGWTSLNYQGSDYPLTQVFVGSNLTTMKIGSQPIFTLNGPLVNSTVFFDDGIYTDNDSTNYVGISQTNASYIGLNKTPAGEPTAILRRLPRSSSDAINNTMERYNIMSQNIYMENLIFDGQGYDMYPTGGSSGISKSRGEYMFYFTGGNTGYDSSGFVMRDCILENIGASNVDSGASYLANKNLAMNFYRSAGQHNFENIVIRNAKTVSGLGIISFNQTRDNYFKNLTIEADSAYNSLSRSIKVENAATDFLAENQNAAVFSGTFSLPGDSYHNHIYIQSWNYDKVVVPSAFRYAQYATSNGSSLAPAILVYADLPAVTANKSILDLADNAWLVQQGASVAVTNQMTAINTTITRAGSRAPEANIKLLADAALQINSLVLPNFGSGRSVRIVAVPTLADLFTGSTAVPFAANGTIQFPSSNAANITLYNFDFHSQAKYTLQEAISGITALGSTSDPNDGGSLTDYPSYDTYAPATPQAARFTNATVANFSNCIFTSLVNQIKIDTAPASLQVGSTFNLSASLAGTSSDSFTGSSFGGTISDTADDRSFYWYSSDPSVASVDRSSGLMTALTTGTVTIFVKATDANNGGEVEKPYAEFTFTVTPKGSGGGGSSSEGGDTTAAAQLPIPFTGLPIPDTGFAPGVTTQLPAQSAALAYQAEDQLWLEIPSLKVKSTITGVPQTEQGWDVDWLGADTGWLNGTAFPTHAGNSVLAAHVFDANGQPGPFAQIKGLKYGDRVIIHAWGQQYIYEVREVKTISPENSSYVFKHMKETWLTLVTCQNYDEKTEQYTSRLAVRAVLVTVK